MNFVSNQNCYNKNSQSQLKTSFNQTTRASGTRIKSNENTSGKISGGQIRKSSTKVGYNPHQDSKGNDTQNLKSTVMKHYFNQTSRNPIKNALSNFEQSITSFQNTAQTPTNHTSTLRQSEAAQKKSRNENSCASIT